MSTTHPYPIVYATDDSAADHARCMELARGLPLTGRLTLKAHGGEALAYYEWPTTGREPVRREAGALR